MPRRDPSQPPKRKGHAPGTKLKKETKNRSHCKLTPEIVKKFCEIVAKGNFRYVACQQLGITKAQYSEWMDTGKKQIMEHSRGLRPNTLIQAEFVVAVDKAEGFCHGKMVDNILTAGSIPAQQWFLERRFWKLYSKNASISHDDETGVTERVDGASVLLSKLSALISNSDTDPVE